ncbi:MAG TPA: lytic transglycosylase domain-containing protein [Amaricoccus sp.]|uniref:lytic transglycosylase domain-containing protein n=1 Tax=Amaricoccus sp. TaxID=1872485 RepID=UPI002CA3EABD|nr:lytic transglycosylase domain-containing protein [Amaricoccus sp.]HMQ92689.1 lytic transglycosylase domain-containing protein [Amaricoccus sp.]HMR52661.1 lytic transglycosylase domain-containing protein [Amaricoccus sp.]HMU00107.1 lytic transglycosylase domain-containing protein [Amaricoccus sp.]
MPSIFRKRNGRITVERPCIAQIWAAFLLSGLAVTTPIYGQALAETPVVIRDPARDPHSAAIAEASARFVIPEHWIRAVMQAESAGDPRAVSHAGAMGLMQVMPGTWSGLREDHGLGADPFDPRDNIIAGTAYLRAMLDRYATVGGMLAAYNAGPGRYDAYLSEGRPLPAETRAYVAMLAPRLDGPAPLPNRATVADWPEAALFTDSSAAHRPQIGGSPDADRTPHETGPAAANLGIFVVRSGPETRP